MGVVWELSTLWIRDGKPPKPQFLLSARIHNQPRGKGEKWQTKDYSHSLYNGNIFPLS